MVFSEKGAKRMKEWGGEKMDTYSARGVLIMAGLAVDLEGNAVGGSVLELDGGGRKVIEILVEELHGKNNQVSTSEYVKQPL